VVEGFPMRKWSIKIVAIGQDGAELPASFIDKVTYNLHPSFPKPTRSTSSFHIPICILSLTLGLDFKKPPFKLEEQGWGEFDMALVLHYAEKGGQKTISHDLNFQAPKYENTHVLVQTGPRNTLTLI
jgi:transcription initiation factor TFIID/TFIIF subunit